MDHPLIQHFDGQRISSGDRDLHTKRGDPPNLKVCARGETQLPKEHRDDTSEADDRLPGQEAGPSRLGLLQGSPGWSVATLNILTTWHGLVPDEEDFIKLSLAEIPL